MMMMINTLQKPFRKLVHIRCVLVHGIDDQWTEKLAHGPTNGKIGLPPLAMVMGVGRQQQQSVAIDLLDLSSASRVNNDYTFLLMFIDVLSKYTR